MARTVSRTYAQQRSWRDKVYVLEILRGLGITVRHLVGNLARLGRGEVGITYQYPETPKPISGIWKGEHRLMLREDGRPRCVACQCCSTACPANCIRIVAGEYGSGEVDKYPVEFDIDILQCVFCGLCVEACPCDAIRMDTGKFPEACYEGPAYVLDIDYLLNNHPEGESRTSVGIY